MSKCLQCQIEYKAKRPSSKFCSGNCRVKYHRKHKSENKTQKAEVGKIELEVLYNKILDLVDKIEKPNIPQKYREPIDRTINLNQSIETNTTHSKRVLVRTKEQWLQLKLTCPDMETWAQYSEQIMNASNLSNSDKKTILNP